MNPDLDAKVNASLEWWNAATPEEREALHKVQCESFVRAMAPCEHGVRDFEECGECRKGATS